MRRRMTEQNRAEARQLYAAGWTITAIGRHLGFLPESIRRIVDERYAARRRESINKAREQRRLTSAAISQRREVDASRSEVPTDTRDLTARLFGDPLPGRSALDQRGVS